MSDKKHLTVTQIVIMKWQWGKTEENKGKIYDKTLTYQRICQRSHKIHCILTNLLKTCFWAGGRDRNKLQNCKFFFKNTLLISHWSLNLEGKKILQCIQWLSVRSTGSHQTPKSLWPVSVTGNLGYLTVFCILYICDHHSVQLIFWIQCENKKTEKENELV